jgi:hypothetical protein
MLAVFLLADFGVAKYQEMKVRDRGARLAQLADMALSRLQAEVQSVADLQKTETPVPIIRTRDDGETVHVVKGVTRFLVRGGEVNKLFHPGAALPCMSIATRRRFFTSWMASLRLLSGIRY